MERSHQGQTWRLALNRLEGTVAGTVVGYFIVIAVANSPYGIAALLTFWVSNASALFIKLMHLQAFISSYVRSDREDAYTGPVAAFTAPIIVFYTYPNSNLDAFRLLSISRIELTFYGVIATFCISVLWPIRAVS